MAGFATYEDITAWQRARKLVTGIYKVTSRNPFGQDYGLKDQIRRATVSICSNIAEGYERRGNKEFVKFLWIAKGSAAEVSSQLYHAKDLGYVSEAEFSNLYTEAKEIGAMLFGLIKAIVNSPEKGLSFVRL